MVAGVLLSIAGGGELRAQLPLQVVGDVPLTGRTTRWDYASIDPDRHMLFLAHLGDSVVTVFDMRQQRVVADIPNVAHVHGVLVLPALGAVYASATGSDEVVVIDDKTYAVTAHIPAGDYPDGMAYAPEVQKLYVSDEHGGTDTVIDVRSNARLTTIPLGGEAGNSQYDPGSRHIFTNVQTRRQLAEIDPASDRVVARIDLPGAQGNHGLYIDGPSRLAFIACEDNDRLLVLDLDTRRVVARFRVGRTPDVLAFDSLRGWLYVASESGEVSVLKVRDRTVQLLGAAWLGPDAHVAAVDPTSHLAYFPLRAWKGRPVLRITQPLP